MVSMSIHGLDEQILMQLQRRAEAEGISLNGLLLRLLQESGKSPVASGDRRKFDDLDALAGTWSDEEAQDFARQTAPFGEVDAALWRSA